MQKQTKTVEEVTDIMEADIEELTEKYISTLRDAEDIYNNKGCINGLLKYLYNNYVGDLLNNKTYRDANRYDIKTLDKLWTIYTNIIYKYQTINPRITIYQYCVFTGISRETLYRYKENIYKGLSPEYGYAVKKWENECQTVLLGDDSIKSIFILKACYGMNDNLQQIPLESQQTTTEALPNLGIGLGSIETVSDVRQIAQSEEEGEKIEEPLNP